MAEQNLRESGLSGSKAGLSPCCPLWSFNLSLLTFWHNVWHIIGFQQISAELKWILIAQLIINGSNFWLKTSSFSKQVECGCILHLKIAPRRKAPGHTAGLQCVSSPSCLCLRIWNERLHSKAPGTLVSREEEAPASSRRGSIVGKAELWAPGGMEQWVTRYLSLETPSQGSQQK